MAKKLTFEIKKNIPFDPAYPSVYPFGKMEVGDCFEFPANLQNKIRSAASMFAKGRMKFATRRINSEIYRCWRIE